MTQPRPLFVDTNAFVALFDEDDDHYPAANAVIDGIQDGNLPYGPIFTNQYVLSQTATTLLYVRLVEDGPLITLYRSGKYIISGCSSLEELHETNRAFLRTLSELNIIGASLDTGFTVQNVVCTGELQQPVNLNALAVGLGLEAVEYEPEQFPGLLYRPPDFPAVLLVFANGNVVITGAADVETAETTFGHLQTQVEDL